MNRYILDREIKVIDTPYGKVRCKTSKGYSVSKVKYEYDDLSRIASENNISIEDAKKLIEENK